MKAYSSRILDVDGCRLPRVASPQVSNDVAGSLRLVCDPLLADLLASTALPLVLCYANMVQLCRPRSLAAADHVAGTTPATATGLVPFHARLQRVFQHCKRGYSVQLSYAKPPLTNLCCPCRSLDARRFRRGPVAC